METLETPSVRTRCYRCGAVVGTASTCPKCRTAQPRVPVSGPVDLDIDLRFDPPIVSARYKTNPHFFLAVLACLFFLPVGLVALYRASQTDTLLKQGDFTGAMSASESAESLSWVGIVCGIFVAVAVAFIVIGFART